MKFSTTCLTALLAASSLSSQVAANSSGAGNCVFGGASVGSIHLSAGTITTGSLADGGFNVKIAGNLASDTPITVSEDDDVVIAVDGAAFKGVLIRIEGTTSDMVTPVDPLKLATNCPNSAAAVTHMNADEKFSASATFSGLPVGSHMVDVDVVVENSGGVSTYYYGAVELTVEAAPMTNNLVDVASAETDLTTLVTAVAQAGLVDTLKDETKEYTVFAPVNTALESFDSKFLEDGWKAHLTHILLYHVVEGSVAKSAVTDGQDVTTLAPEEPPLKARVSSGDLFLSGAEFTDSKVTQADLMADNGIIHKVDQFFLPSVFSMDLLALAENTDGFDQVATLLGFSSLQDEVKADGRTIFSPGAAAFEKPANQALLPQIQADPSLVDKILSNHLAVGVFPRAMLLSPDFDKEIEMFSGRVFAITTEGSDTLIDGITISQTDLLASNGIAHIIDDVLLEGVMDPEPTASPVEGGGEPSTDSGSAVVSTVLGVATAAAAAALVMLF